MLERFPEKLKVLRTQRGLSQRELARQLGIAESYICHFEQGRRKPRTELTIQIAAFFGVSVDVLIRDELELDSE
jgi:transcriptional regulator with XRE-family HTH domain